MADLTAHVDKLKTNLLANMDTLPGEDVYYKMLALDTALKVHEPSPATNPKDLELLSPTDAKYGDGRITASSQHGAEATFGSWAAFNATGVHSGRAEQNWHNNPFKSAWISIKLAEQPFVYEYAITTTSNITIGKPSDWLIEVSDDSTNGVNGRWFKVDERRDSSFDWQSRAVFKLPQPVRALWFRLRVTKVIDPSSNENWQIDLLEYWGKKAAVV